MGKSDAPAGCALLLVPTVWLGFADRVAYLQGTGELDLNPAVLATLVATPNVMALATLCFLARRLFP